MDKRVTRTMSYTKVQTSRRLEILCVAFVIGSIIVGTITLIAFRRESAQVAYKPFDAERCGPNFTEFSVDISDAEEVVDLGYVSKEAMTFPPGTFWKANESVFGCPCSIKPCIRKCCPPGQSYDPRDVTCVPSNFTPFKPFRRQVFSTLTSSDSIKDLKQKPVDDDHFFIFHGDVCPNDKFLKEPIKYQDDWNFLMEDGRILIVGPIPYLDQSEYCLESFVGDDTIHTLECFGDQSEELMGEQKQEWMYTLLSSGMIVSVPFLLVTFLVYALLPQLQNLHGKALMCHVVCLIVAYTALPVVQIGKEHIPLKPCVVLAFIVQFTFLGSFFWLNVMCFDIWWVFSGLMPLRGSVREAEHMKFLIYSAYAWGGPLIITSMSAIMDLAPWIPHSFIKPEFGITRCWFKEDEALVLYFYLPIGVLVSLNLMMFVTTSCRLRAHTKDAKVFQTADSRRHHDAERQRFNLYLKLFIVMGITWVMELVSFIGGGTRLIWIVSDLGNTLQGLLIFFIFVCKRRILRLLNQRLCPRVDLISPTASMKNNSSRTNSSRFSRTSSADQIAADGQISSYNPNLQGDETKL